MWMLMERGGVCWVVVGKYASLELEPRLRLKPHTIRGNGNAARTTTSRAQGDSAWKLAQAVKYRSECHMLVFASGQQTLTMSCGHLGQRMCVGMFVLRHMSAGEAGDVNKGGTTIPQAPLSPSSPSLDHSNLLLLWPLQNWDVVPSDLLTMSLDAKESFHQCQFAAPGSLECEPASGPQPHWMLKVMSLTACTLCWLLRCTL